MSGLDPSERRLLLDLARAAIESRLRGADRVDALLERATLTPAVRETRGAFVSLKLSDPDDAARRALRGCIGQVVGRAPLYRNIIVMAQKAAFEDPRFPPLSADEWPRLIVEISALTPLTAVSGPERIRPGRDGVQLESAGRVAVFLPQVAAERGWNVEELLSQLALKAGLARDGWRGARLAVFQAEVFDAP